MQSKEAPEAELPRTMGAIHSSSGHVPSGPQWAPWVPGSFWQLGSPHTVPLLLGFFSAGSSGARETHAWDSWERKPRPNGWKLGKEWAGDARAEPAACTLDCQDSRIELGDIQQWWPLGCVGPGGSIYKTGNMD